MDVKEAIEKRRAYRAFDPVEITDAVMNQLASAAQLMPSCFNNQPWRMVFVRDRDMLTRMHDALSQGNDWAKKASLIIAVFGKKGDDCILEEREYYLFDIGMAVSALMLRATELDLVAHPIAGYSPEKVKEILGIPDEHMVITLINVGKKSNDISGLKEHQLESEKDRPERRELDMIYSVDRYSKKLDE
jgi:nitroreductase